MSNSDPVLKKLYFAKKSSHFYLVARKTFCGERGCRGRQFACVFSLITFTAEEGQRKNLIGGQSRCSRCAKSPQSPLCPFAVLITPLHEKLGSSSMHSSTYTRTHTQVR